MGSTNHGTQQIMWQYFQEATGANWGKRLLGILLPGIYSGGHLTKVSDTEVTLSTLVAEIKDGTNQINVRTAAAATLNSATLDSGAISSATPYLVLRWAYALSATNYVEVHAISSVSVAQANDIVIGKCLFSGSILTGFNYSERTFLNVQDLFFKVETSSGLYVQLRAGRIHTSTGYVLVPDQLVGPFSVPTGSNLRIDLVYIDTDGTVTILQGTQAVSPSAPTYGGKLAVAEITLVNGDVNISASRIRDVRSFLIGKLNEFNPSSYSGQESTTFPNGRIEKEGTVSVSGGVAVSVVFSVPFPTEIRNVQISIQDANNSTANSHFYNLTKDGFTISPGTISIATIHWRAVGR